MCSVVVDRPPVHTKCNLAVEWPQCVVSGRFCARKLLCLLTGVTLAKSEWHNLLFQLRPLMTCQPSGVFRKYCRYCISWWSNSGPWPVIGCTQLRMSCVCIVLGYVQSERLMLHQIVSAVFVKWRRCHVTSEVCTKMCVLLSCDGLSKLVFVVSLF